MDYIIAPRAEDYTSTLVIGSGTYGWYNPRLPTEVREMGSIGISCIVLGRGNCCVEIPGQEPTHQVTGQDYGEIPQSSNLCSGTLKRIMHQAR